MFGKKTLVCQHVELHWIWTGHYSRNKIYACALVPNADACCNGKIAQHETRWSECNSNNRVFPVLVLDLARLDELDIHSLS